ncbi:MAG TPA: hypothetical protein VMX54_20810 [Vicinamibacteria bacterium]|nr:hypothetical protein [Vicinamibacteria bacterium]
MKLEAGIRGRLIVAACCALLASHCGGGGSKSPSSPGVPVPTPVAATPTPVPTIAPLSQTCVKLGPGSAKATCNTQPPDFMGELTGTIQLLQAQHPEMFKGDQVLNTGAYAVDFIKQLDKDGYCAQTDDGLEFSIKHDNGYSEEYSILSSKGGVRRFYLYTCEPANFPVPGATPTPTVPPPAGCTLPPSTYVACGRPGSGNYIDDVLAAVKQMEKDHPELFDYTDTKNGQPRAKDPLAYQKGVIALLAAQGYCGIFDGEEVLLKRTNDFSEHYKINLSDVYVRTDTGIYRAACYPAAF